MTDDTKIKLYTSGRPWAAHGDVSEFDDFIPIDEFLARCFFNRSPDLPANFRQNINFYKIIFQLDNFPFLLPPFFAIALECGIRKNFRSFRRDCYNGTGIIKWIS